MKKIIIILLLLCQSAYCFPQKEIRDSELFSAAAMGRTNVLESWIAQNKDINVTDCYGNTPLLIASEDGQYSFVKRLVDAGADVNIKNKYGYTPLLAAVTNNHLQIALLLENYGADPAIENQYFTSVEDYFKAAGVKNLKEYEQSGQTGAQAIGPNALRYLNDWEKEYITAGFLHDDNITKAAMDNVSVYAGDGDPFAAEIYGHYLDSRNDRVNALKYYFIAANNGMPASMMILGREYIKNRDYADGGRLMCAAASQGEFSAISGCASALLFYYKDYPKALEYFQEAYSLGDNEALYYVGLMKYSGLGTVRNPASGLADIHKAAKSGVAPAVNQLKKFATEDALSFLSRYPKLLRSQVRTYMITQGAVLIADTGCDKFDVSNYFSPDSGISEVTLCYPSLGEVPTLEMTVNESQMEQEFRMFFENYIAVNNITVKRVD